MQSELTRRQHETAAQLNQLVSEQRISLQSASMKMAEVKQVRLIFFPFLPTPRLTRMHMHMHHMYWHHHAAIKRHVAILNTSSTSLEAMHFVFVVSVGVMLLPWSWFHLHLRKHTRLHQGNYMSVHVIKQKLFMALSRATPCGVVWRIYVASRATSDHSL
jgi:hypothetical protein